MFPCLSSALNNPEAASHQSTPRVSDAHHATLGIVGLGRIGYQVARRAVGFDMEICYHTRKRYVYYR